MLPLALVMAALMGSHWNEKHHSTPAWWPQHPEAQRVQAEEGPLPPPPPLAGPLPAPVPLEAPDGGRPAPALPAVTAEPLAPPAIGRGPIHPSITPGRPAPRRAPAPQPVAQVTQPSPAPVAQDTPPASPPATDQRVTQAYCDGWRLAGSYLDGKRDVLHALVASSHFEDDADKGESVNTVMRRMDELLTIPTKCPTEELGK